jgi:hypothetical protein
VNAAPGRGVPAAHAPERQVVRLRADLRVAARRARVDRPAVEHRPVDLLQVVRPALVDLVAAPQARVADAVVPRARS